MRSFHELAQLASTGASFIIYAHRHSVMELEEIVKYAEKGGGRITLKGCDRLSLDHLKTIAAGAKGVVVFDFTEPA